MPCARASSPPAGWGSWCAATASFIGSLRKFLSLFPLLGITYQMFFQVYCVDLAFAPAVAAGGI